MSELAIYRDIRKDERRKTALEIIDNFSVDAPLPSNANNLKLFTQGVNSERKHFIDFAWSLGAKQE